MIMTEIPATDAAIRTGVQPRTTSTASAIAQIAELADRATVAAVGVALHHFTEPMVEPPTLVLHRATTVLSKQVRPLIDQPGGLDAIKDLVTDPHRVALPDGRTAAEVCGDSWANVLALASERATSACEGAATFGNVAVLNLAVIRGVNTRHPWWGTTAWNRRVDEWLSNRSHSSLLRADLLTSPERVADDVLWDVLHS